MDPRIAAFDRFREGDRDDARDRISPGFNSAKALSKALRRTLGADIPIRRCKIHRARNISDRLAPKHHAAVRRALKQALQLNDADKAERLMRNLARRFEQEAPDVSA